MLYDDNFRSQVEGKLDDSMKKSILELPNVRYLKFLTCIWKKSRKGSLETAITSCFRELYIKKPNI